jgi:serine/threonine protein kinase
MSGTSSRTPNSALLNLKDADYEKSSPIEKTYQRQKTVDDPRFGQVTIYNNPSTRNYVAMKERKVTDRAEAGRLIAAARERMNMRHPNLINMLDYSVTKQSELCSSFYIIKYFYEFPKNDLRKQFTDRQKQGQGFNSQELTNILYQQIQAQSYLQSQGLAHGDIQPVLIGYDPERKESKLIDKSDLATNEQAVIAMQKNHLLSSSTQSLYQSPTMYQNLKKGNQKFAFDKNKEDAYALGLVLLEAGNGRKIDNIYDGKTGTVDQNALNNHLNEFKGKFEGGNQLLTSTVSSLVNPDESQRPSPVQVQSNLPPFEEVQKFFSQNTSTSLQGGQSTNTYTRTEIDGGSQNIVIKDKVEMPNVDIDLFSFNPQNNQYNVQSPVYQEETVRGEPEQFVVSQPKYVFKHQSQPYETSTRETQVVYNEPLTETRYETYTQPQYSSERVYSEAPVTYNTSSYIPTQTVQRVYAEQPVQTVGRSVTYSQPQVVSYNDQSYSTASYTQPSVHHEFILHDSSVVKPEVITNDSYTTQAYQAPTSQVVYASAPTYYSQRNNEVYREAPTTTYQTTTAEPEVRRVSYRSQTPTYTSYSQAPAQTYYTQAPTQTYYTQAPTQTVYTEGSRSNIVYAEAPETTYTYTQEPTQTVYTEAPKSTVVYSTAPTHSVYTESPYTTTTRVVSNAEPVYTTQYANDVPSSEVIYTSSPQVTYVQGSPYNVTGGSQTHISSSNFDTTGLKLVKTYTDNRLATEQRNY